MDGMHHAGLERLDDLGAAGRDDLAGGGGDDIDRADAGPESAMTKNAMMVPAMARPAGEAGVSTISSAAGRNSQLVRCAGERARHAGTG